MSELPATHKHETLAILRTIDKRGTLVLPLEVRQGVKHVEIVRRPDGVIELRPKAIIDQTQAWFWSERWQAMEREVEVEIEAGRLQSFEDGEDLIAALDESATALDAARVNP